MPQLVISSGAFGALATGIQIHSDKTTGMVQRLRSLPIARSAYLLGAVLADLVRAFVSAIVIVAVGHLVGFRFDQGVPGAIGMFVVAVGFGSVFGWFAAWSGMKAEQLEAIGSIMNGPVLLLFFLSTASCPSRGSRARPNRSCG